MMQMQPLSLYASNDDGLVQCGTSANISCTVIAKLDTLVGNNGQQLGVVSEISAMSASNELPSGQGVYPVHNACDAGGLHGAACCMVQGNYMTNAILFCPFMQSGVQLLRTGMTGLTGLTAMNKHPAGVSLCCTKSRPQTGGTSGAQRLGVWQLN